MTDDPFSSRMASVAQRPKNPWPARIALIIGAIVAFVWAGVQTILSVSKKPADGGLGTSAAGVDGAEAAGAAIGYALGTAVGTAFIVGGLIWLVIYFAFLKPSGRRSGPQYFAVLAIAAVFGAGPVLVLEIMGAGNRAVREQVAANTVQIQADEKALLAEMTAIGLTQEDSTVRAARDLSAATRDMATAHAILDRYEALRETRMKELRGRVAATASSEGQRKRYTAEIDGAWAKLRPLLDRRWALERRTLGVREELVALLKRSRGRWRINGDMVVFSNQRDLNDAQLLMNEMHAIGRERTKLDYDLDVLEAKEKGEPAPPPPPPDLTGPPTIPIRVTPIN